MSAKNAFGGGWLDIRMLLQGLGGRPFQAEFEEVFTPSSGDPAERRAGRVFVDSRRRVRLDVQREGLPAVMFLHDAARQLMLCGLVDQPETWVRSPWAVSIEPVRAVPAADAPPGIPLRTEFVDAEGTHLSRLFNVRYDEPDESLFPR